MSLEIPVFHLDKQKTLLGKLTLEYLKLRKKLLIYSVHRLNMTMNFEDLKWSLRKMMILINGVSWQIFW